MDSGIECMTGQVVRSSSRAVRKAASVSPPELVSLRTPAEFSRVLREGKRYRSGGVVLVRLAGPTGPARLGLVASKGAGNAVTRNRIKRRLRHTARSVGLQPGNDYVIIATSQVATIPQSELEGWLKRAIGAVS